MARAIRHGGDQAGMWCSLGVVLIEHGADGLHNLAVAAFAVAANAIALTQLPLGGRQEQRGLCGVEAGQGLCA